MTQLDRIISGIDTIENALTLKSSYSDEINDLDQIASDLSVMRYIGAPRWKINDAISRINQIKKWMRDEEAAAQW